MNHLRMVASTLGVRVNSGTSGFNIAAALGNPVGPVSYALAVPLSVVIGNTAPGITLDGTDLHEDSLGTWIVDGKGLGGGGNAFNGGEPQSAPTGGGGGGGGGGAGYPAGTGGLKSTDTDVGQTDGADGSDTSTGATAGGAAGTSVFASSAIDYWNEANYGKTAAEAEFPNSDVPVIASGGDAARVNHAITIRMGAAGRLWGGGAAGRPGYQNFASGQPVLYGSSGGSGGDVGAGTPDEGGSGFNAGGMIDGTGGYAVRLVGPKASVTFVGPYTGDPYVKGTVG